MRIRKVKNPNRKTLISLFERRLILVRRTRTKRKNTQAKLMHNILCFSRNNSSLADLIKSLEALYILFSSGLATIEFLYFDKSKRTQIKFAYLFFIFFLFVLVRPFSHQEQLGELSRILFIIFYVFKKNISFH